MADTCWAVCGSDLVGVSHPGGDLLKAIFALKGLNAACIKRGELLAESIFGFIQLGN